MERLSILYASALYDLAVKKDATKVFLEQAIMIRDSLSDGDCQKVLAHPQISAAQKHEFFSTAFSGKIHEDLLGFLFLVADKNREAYLLSALAALIDMIEQSMNIVTARVLSAAEYDDNKADTLKKMLSKKLNKDVRLLLSVDPSVIGGPYIYADGYYIDWTVKKKLRDLAANMKEGCTQ
ncbi:MAG: ATP synthase F1 subunit delta [Oscillospiraceae bacterium]|nr:ATP synthase F1 subunit delta [Oscillospiraceae bacterium]